MNSMHNLRDEFLILYEMYQVLPETITLYLLKLMISRGMRELNEKVANK